MSNTKLNLKGNQEETLIQQFKNREEQTSLEEALVYLKLRNHKCNSSKALIFSKKQEKCIDGTIAKDGPAACRKLEVLKPESKLVNGWLRGQKLKYAGTTGYTDYLRKHESAQKKSITSYNQKSRLIEQQMRRTRSKLTVVIDLAKPRQSVEKISALKQDASKERQNRNIYLEYQGVRLDQTTKNFFKNTDGFNEEGLIVKLGAFDQLMTDQQLSLTMDLANLRGKSLSYSEIRGNKKRQKIMQYQEKINDHKPTQETWKRLVHKSPSNSKEMRFKSCTLKEASNPLILMNSKKLKLELEQNENKWKQNMTQYSNFHNSIEKAMKIQFLDKRKYSHCQMRRPKKHQIQS